MTNDKNETQRNKMRKKACFICNTSFQIMSALSIQLENNYDATICIDPLFELGKYYKERLETTGIFEAIVLVDKNDKIYSKVRENKNKISRIINIIKIYISDYGKKFLPSSDYDYIFTTTNAFLYKICIWHLRKKKCRTIFYDDGEGSYDDFLKIEKAHRREQLINFLYAPELFRLCYPNSNTVTKRIRHWNEDQGIKDLLEKVFGQCEKAQIKEKVIIIDTIKSEAIHENEFSKLDDIYKRIVQLFGYENVIIKKHPRDTRESMGIKEYAETSIPFEYIALESDISEKIIVSLSSSATIMPKIILDQEPVVVLLYKMFNMKIGEDATRALMYDNCMQMYRNRNKFIVPNSLEELESELKKII